MLLHRNKAISNINNNDNEKKPPIRRPASVLLHNKKIWSVLATWMTKSKIISSSTLAGNCIQIQITTPQLRKNIVSSLPSLTQKTFIPPTDRGQISRSSFSRCGGYNLRKNRHGRAIGQRYLCRPCSHDDKRWTNHLYGERLSSKRQPQSRQYLQNNQHRLFQSEIKNRHKPKYRSQCQPCMAECRLLQGELGMLVLC